MEIDHKFCLSPVPKFTAVSLSLFHLVRKFISSHILLYSSPLIFYLIWQQATHSCLNSVICVLVISIELDLIVSASLLVLKHKILPGTNVASVPKFVNNF
jgi:hypothetical protein